MTHPFTKTLRRAAGVLLAVLLCCAGGRAQESGAGTASADYDQLVVSANSLLKQGKLDEAQQTAKQAIKLEAKRFEAYALAAKIASQRGAAGEASDLVQKALELAPEADKAKVRQLAAMLAPTGSPARVAAAASLSDEDQLTLDVLNLILKEAGEATGDELARLLREFLSKSAAFATAHPEHTNLWAGRALAALKLDEAQTGWLAGRQLKAMGAVHSQDPSVRAVLMRLERRGWLSASPPPQLPMAGSTWTNSLGMKLVPVPGTEVLFCVWDTRVQDFEAFVKATGHDATAGMYSLRSDGVKQRGDTWKSPGFSQGPTHPVCGVSWEDAQAFCRWLTDKEQKGRLIGPEQGFRLPTDAEWSIAVGLSEESGGTPRDKHMQVKGVYPWGTEWPPPEGAGNYAGSEAATADWPSNFKTVAGYRDGYARTSPVGSFRANRFGLYDMGGNVWQWCEDWYDAEQKGRVLRGGSWISDAPGNLLSSYRYDTLPVNRDVSRGFRCVLVVGLGR